MPVKLIEHRWAQAPCVRIVATTRYGGASAAPYNSLNLGLNTGDQVDFVQANRARLQHELGLAHAPLFVRQVHGSEVLPWQLVKADQSAADGLHCDENGVAIGVLTADCVPLVFCDRKERFVAVVHAGWRGLAQGIVEKAVSILHKSYQVQASEILCWAGPCISQTHFEVGEEVKLQLGGPEQAWQASINKGKWMANLPLLVQSRLALQGISEFVWCGQCTFTNADHFYSYRRDGDTGRQATIAWLQEG